MPTLIKDRRRFPGTRLRPRVEKTYNSYRAWFGLLLHFHVDKADFGALQAWMEGQGDNYVIEITLVGGACVTLEYSDRAVWEALLIGWARVLA